MSLELAIQENTAAIHALIAKLSADAFLNPQAAPPAAQVQEIPAQLKKTKPPKPAKSSEPTPTASSSSETSSTESSAAEAVEEQPPASFEDAKKALLTLYKSQADAEKGRALTTDALARFGAAKLSDLLPEHYTPFIALVDEVLAGGQV